MPKLIHERWKCIGCGACAAVTPDFWEMMDDGKAAIKVEHTTKSMDEGELQETEIKEEDVSANKEAVDACPVECIHIK